MKMNMRIAVCISGLMIFASAKIASAQGIFDIYNDLVEPGDGFDQNSYGGVDNYTNIESFYQYQAEAMPFTPGAGSNVMVSVLYVGLRDLSGGSSPLLISIAQDNAGSPGTVLETMAGTVTSPSLYTFTSSLNPVLTGGTQYWVVAEGDTGANAAWLDCGTGGRPSMYSPDGSSWFNDGEGYALKVEGTAPVPEPPTAVLGGFGILMMLGFLRRRGR